MEPVIFNSQVQILNQAGGAVIEPPTLAAVQALLSQTGFDTKFDVLLSTRASESTLSSLNSKVTACNTGAVVVSSLPAVTQGTSPWVIGDGGGSITVDGTISVSGAVDTELPAAAALTDNFANPTAPAVGAFNMGWDGTNWDRIRADGGAVFIQDGGNSITVDGAVSISGAVDTELPAAASLTDNFANPTAPAVGSFLMGFDGTTWDRVRADGGSVFIQDGGNSITVDGTVGISGTVAVTQSGGWSVSITGTATVDTELPAAAALTDNFANPTAPAVGAFNMGWDGTNWDRIRADGGAVFIQDGGNSITVDGTVGVSGTVTVDSELPAAAALADNASNPTVPGVGAFLMGFDGTTWDRVRADGGSVFIQDGGNSITVDGTITANQGGTWNITNISGTVSLPTGASTSANQSTEITSLQLIDDVVHSGDATLSKYAVLGGVYDDVSTVAVTENNAQSVRINKVRSLATGRVQSISADLSNVNTTYNNSTTTASSQDVDCDGMAWASLSFELTSANTPTDLQFIMETKDEEDADYRPIQNEFWGRLKISGAEVASQQKYAFPRCPISEGAINIRCRVVATGTDASKTFTLANAKIGLGTAA